MARKLQLDEDLNPVLDENFNPIYVDEPDEIELPAVKLDEPKVKSLSGRFGRGESQKPSPSITMGKAYSSIFPRTAKAYADENVGPLRTLGSAAFDVMSLPGRGIATLIGEGKMSDIGSEGIATTGLPGYVQRFSENTVRDPLNVVPTGLIARGVKEVGLAAKPLIRGLAEGAQQGLMEATRGATETGEVDPWGTAIAAGLGLGGSTVGTYASGQAVEDLGRNFRVPTENVQIIEKYATPSVFEGRSADEIRGKLGVEIEKMAKRMPADWTSTFKASGADVKELPDVIGGKLIDDLNLKLKEGRITLEQYRTATALIDDIKNVTLQLPTPASQLSYMIQNMPQTELGAIDKLLGTYFGGGPNLNRSSGLSNVFNKEELGVLDAFDALKGAKSEAGAYVRNPEPKEWLIARRRLTAPFSGTPASGGTAPLMGPFTEGLDMAIPQIMFRIPENLRRSSEDRQ